MKLVYDDQALADLEDIFNWIAQDSPATAKTVVDRLFSSTELLISFPFMGHTGRDPETFEWVVPRLPYIVVYEVDRAQERVTALDALIALAEIEARAAHPERIELSHGRVRYVVLDDAGGAEVPAFIGI